MGKLSTHILDTMHGKPASDVRIQLYSIQNEKRTLLNETRSNSDGRCDEPLLQGDQMAAGVYELVFHAGDYFAAKGVSLPSPRFLDQIVLRFGISNPSESYHVPLVVTPWTYSTYRGS